MNNIRQHKIKQFEEIEINETQKDTPSSKYDETQINEMDQTSNSIQQEELEKKYDFNVVPMKVVALTIFLLLLGGVFLIFGLVYFFRNPKKLKQTVSMLIIGSLMLIPGIYYSCLLIKFTKADSRSIQRKILNELPID